MALRPDESFPSYSLRDSKESNLRRAYLFAMTIVMKLATTVRHWSSGVTFRRFRYPFCYRLGRKHTLCEQSAQYMVVSDIYPDFVVDGCARE
jgi:hypothetical protein